MNARFWLPAIGMALLCACAKQPVVPNGTQILDEELTLSRPVDKPFDTATRELAVGDGSILVAFIDENLTDVKLNIATVVADKYSPKPVEVENNLLGSGMELAMFEVPEEARVRVTVTGARNAVQPGKVRLRVRQYSASAMQDPKFASQLRAFKAWTLGTASSIRVDEVKKTGLLEMQSAIHGFDSPQGDATLSAHAHLIRARMLYAFRIDWREARDEAQRARAAFAKLPTQDALYEARAKLAEALALVEMSNDQELKDPGPEQAKKLAREMFEQLSAPTSVLGQIERARAVSALGALDLTLMLINDSTKHFEQARQMYAAAGYTAGELEERCNLAQVLVEQGKFADAALLFDAMLPQIDKIARPEVQVKAYLTAARAYTFSGRTDEGAELMLKSLPIAQENQLHQQEGTALQGLSYAYQLRGDLLQASAFSNESLKIARNQNDVMEYVMGLVSAGVAARANGDLDKAFELHREAVRLAPNPVAQVRTRLDLGVDYYRIEDLPNAIAQFRDSLAVDLHDPMSHVYSDSKLGLAMFILEYDKSTSADLKEAGKLIAESMETAVKVRAPFYVIYATRVQAQLDARLGKTEAARAGFERVFKLGQAYRQRSASSEARSNILVDEQRAFRGYLDVVFASAAKRGPGVFAAAAPAEVAGMRWLEQTRFENFGALRVASADAQTIAQEDKLLTEMAQKSLRIEALLKSGLSTEQAAELQALQVDMARLHFELDILRTSAAARITSVTSTSTKAAGTRAWRPLEAGSAQVSYALSEKHVYALVRSESGTSVTVLAPSRKDLEKQLIEFAKLDAQTSSRQIETALEQISAVLLPAGLLPANTSAVEIVAEGRIASVPFPALRSPTDSNRRLAETHVVAMVTSLLDVDPLPPLRHARPFRFVALASGSGTYRAAALDPTPRLQAATKEIRVAADLFTARDQSAKVRLLMGADGTSSTLRGIWSSGADVVHFATHALADLRQPIASLLVLPAMDANGKATYLTAGQVQGWRGDVELVFLSACESAIGPPQYASGMPGLQRAFLRAGARGVIATLAPIEDVFAQEFAADFYARYTSGMPASRALSETQRAWLAPKPGLSADEQLRRRVTALSHAYFTG
jgi:CHAT domain-containing protein